MLVAASVAEERVKPMQLERISTLADFKFRIQNLDVESLTLRTTKLGLLIEIWKPDRDSIQDGIFSRGYTESSWNTFLKKFYSYFTYLYTQLFSSKLQWRQLDILYQYTTIVASTNETLKRSVHSTGAA